MLEARRKWITCQCIQACKSGYYSSFNHYTHTRTTALCISHVTSNFPLLRNSVAHRSGSWYCKCYCEWGQQTATSTHSTPRSWIFLVIFIKFHSFTPLRKHCQQCSFKKLDFVTLQKNVHFGRLPIIAILFLTCKVNLIAIMHETINWIIIFLLYFRKCILL